MLSIVIAGTKNYLYAFDACVSSVVAAAQHHKDVHFVFVTDSSKESFAAEERVKSLIYKDWFFSTLRLEDIDDEAFLDEKYKTQSQLNVARLQGAGFEFARRIGSDFCWVVESDTVVPAESLRVLEWTLSMPTADGSPYYDIAAATYPNTLFLGGFGSIHNQINEDFLPEERILPKRLKLCYEESNKRLEDLSSKKEKSPLLEKEVKRIGRLRKKIKDCPPDGNIWEVIAKHGWRRRGWFDFAYPGIGRGSIVPSDWCGLGCTLLSKKALLYSEFCGYEGHGTQDCFCAGTNGFQPI